MRIYELEEGIFDRWFGSQESPTVPVQPVQQAQSTPNQSAQQNQTTQPKKVKYEPGARGPIIADLQKVLVALGYGEQVGTPDGVFGAGTIKAIAKFQTDQKLPDNTGVVDHATINKLNELIKSKLSGQLPKSTQADVAKPKPPKEPTSPPSVAPLPASKLSNQGKQAAEAYLGRKMSGEEWNFLVRATAAESTNNATEQAYIMAVILNRVRNGRWGKDIISVLTAQNQFQAVTGTSADPGPSELFDNPSGKLKSIFTSAINTLNKVPRNFLYFTAKDEAAYKAGTDPTFRKQLSNKKGSVTIGGTIFG